MTEDDPEDVVVEEFQLHRGRLIRLAYRLLGSRADAEDAVQETWLRLARCDTAVIDNLGGWLTTVVARICLDVLRSRRVRPETSYEDWLPELVVTEDRGAAPDDEALLAESLGLALLVVLDTLEPAERVAFILHDLFAVPFDDIGRVVGRSTDASKMLASRARPPSEQWAERMIISCARHDVGVRFVGIALAPTGRPPAWQPRRAAVAAHRHPSRVDMASVEIGTRAEPCST